MHITHAHSYTYTPTSTPTPLHTHPHSLPLRKSLLFQEVEVILQFLVLCLHFAQLLSVPCHRGSPAGLLLLHSAPELLHLGSRTESTIEEWTFLACLHSRITPLQDCRLDKAATGGMHDSNTHTHARTHACTHARTHACTHTRTHTHTHTLLMLRDLL